MSFRRLPGRQSAYEPEQFDPYHRCKETCPKECEKGETFVCNACERRKSWHEGCADDTPGLCDECWGRLICN